MTMKPRLVALMRANAERPRDFRVENAASGDEATIYIYDIIGLDFWTGEGITAKSFADALAGINASTIHLRINSPGGDVFEARAIIAQMQASKAKFIAHVDGVAASAASVIAVNCAEVQMAEGSFMMVHKAWTFAMGNDDEMISVAAFLKKIDGTIAADYAKKTGDTVAQAAAWMKAETWFTAEEAVSAGLANSIAADAPKAKARWNLSAYDNAPAMPELEAENTIDEAEIRAHLERRLALVEQIA
jgi:ATP-dependent Clp protease protease subunit